MPVTQPSGAVTKLIAGSFVDAKFSRDGSKLYAVADTAISVVNIADGTLSARYTVGNKLGGFDLSADGRYLAVAEANDGGVVPVVYRIDLTTGTIIALTATGYEGRFYDVGYVSDGSLIISGLENLMATRFDTAQIYAAVTRIGVASIQANADHSKLSIERAERTTPIYTYTSPNQISAGVNGIDDPYAGPFLAPITLVQTISPSGDRVAQNYPAILYDGNLGNPRPLFQSANVSGSIRGLAFSPAGDVLYSLLDAGSAQLIASDPRTGTALASYDLGVRLRYSDMTYNTRDDGFGSLLHASADPRYLELVAADGVVLVDVTKLVASSGPGADTLSGSGYLLGLGGNDTLTATAEYTTLSGGPGDDVYYVNAFNVWVFEGENQGHDVVHTTVGATLGFYVEDLVLDGTASISGTGNDLANLMVGNSGDNRLTGNGGDDTLQGGGGADTLEGGQGADLLEGGDGDDVLASSGAGDYQPFGDAFDPLAERDTLRGGAGNDRLFAGYGDVIDGGTGTDALWLDLKGATSGVDLDLRGLLTSGASVMLGGGTIADVEQVLGIKGSNFADRINMQVDAWSAPSAGMAAVYGLGGNDIIMAGIGVALISGGDGDDQLFGYGAASLDGGAGNDLLYATPTSAILYGGDGDDTYVVRGVIPRIEESAGYDTVFVDNVGYSQGVYRLDGSAQIEFLTTQSNSAVSAVTIAGNGNAQVIVGDWGNNLLIGGGVWNPGEADVLIGLRGDDRYVVDSVRTVVFEAAGEGADVVTVSAAASNFVLNAATSVETLQAAAGTDAINITGNPDAQVIIGNEGANILSGAGGGDTLIGLGGNDTYQVRSMGDQVVEANGGGYDVVFATVSYSLGANEVEMLSTVVQAANDPINLIGNYATQLVIGNYGNNVLNGGSGGVDTLIGLFGDDTYAVGDARVVVVENAGQGNDTVVTSVSYQLRTGVSVETLAAQNRSGTEALVLTGNETAQVVAGNDGANTIDGRGGADTLVGGGGADVFAFTTAAASGNADTILDFQAGVDRIGLASDVFATVTDGGIQAGELAFGTAAQDGDDRLVYDQASGRLFYDADGNGTGAALLLAQLAAGTTLTTASFVAVAPVMDLAA